MEHDASTLTRTHICRQPGCANEARSDRGLYSKCDEHRGRATTTPTGNAGGGSDQPRRAARVAQDARARRRPETRPGGEAHAGRARREAGSRPCRGGVPHSLARHAEPGALTRA